MKRTLTFFLFAFLSLQLSAQSGLDNLDFENWTASGIAGNPAPNGFYTIGQSENTNDPYAGNSALTIQNVEVQVDTGGGTITDTVGFTSLDESGYRSAAYDECPDSLTGWVKHDLQNQDTAAIVLYAYTTGGNFVTGNQEFFEGEQGSWEKINVDFPPCGSQPDSILLEFSTSVFGSKTPGSTFELDQFYLHNQNNTSIQLFGGGENEYGAHPNPASQNVRFEFGPQAQRIRVFDMTGRSVRTVQVDQRKQQRMQVGDLKDGLYIYRVEDDKGRELHSDKLQIVR